MRCVRLLFVFAAAALFLAALTVLPSRLCFEKGRVYTFYCGDSSKNCTEITAGDLAGFTRFTLKEVCGEGTEYDSLDIESFLKSVNGSIVFTEELSDSVNYYCTADLPYSVTLYGASINLHICVRENGVKVASPIIFGGY